MAFTLLCQIVTPESSIYSGEAQFVAIPSYEGEVGIAPLHAPYVATLGAGECRIADPETGDVNTRYALMGGYVEVKNDKVIILADFAINAEDINLDEVREKLEGVKEQLKEADKSDARRVNMLELKQWYETQIRVSGK